MPNRLAAIERAIQSIQEQLNRQPEILKPDFQEAASEIVNRETILLRKDLDDVASFPKIRRAGFVFLLVGVALTGIGNLGASELLW